MQFITYIVSFGRHERFIYFVDIIIFRFSRYFLAFSFQFGFQQMELIALERPLAFQMELVIYPLDERCSARWGGGVIDYKISTNMLHAVVARIITLR